jgi:membrane protease YdiL (CAAX protease family)
VIYRGVLYSAFQRTIGVAGAVAFVTFIFALVHLPQYYESPSTLALLLLLSLALTLMRVYSGNLLPCIIFHTIVNGFQSAALIAEPYLKEAAGISDTAAAFFGFK